MEPKMITLIKTSFLFSSKQTEFHTVPKTERKPLARSYSIHSEKKRKSYSLYLTICHAAVISTTGSGVQLSESLAPLGALFEAPWNPLVFQGAPQTPHCAVVQRGLIGGREASVSQTVDVKKMPSWQWPSQKSEELIVPTIFFWSKL